MNLLFLLRPKGLGGWVCLTGLAVALWTSFTPEHSPLQAGLILTGLAAFLTVLGYTLPPSITASVARLRIGFRLLIFCPVAYVLVVTVFNFAELYSFRLWLAFLLPGGDSPFNHTHILGLIAAAYMFCAQTFHIPRERPTDFEKVMPGEPFLINQQTAAKQAHEKIES